MTQTAIQQAIDKLRGKTFPPRSNVALGVSMAVHILEQFLELEKEQILDAHIEGQRVFDKHPHTQWTDDQAKQYYNETYGSQGSPDK